MCKVVKDYNDVNFSKYVKYDESSPTGLVWIVNKGSSGKIGNKAGRGKPFEHSYVSINKVTYLCHRVIWKLTYGYIDPNLVIDHIDGNPLNNNIKNLRLVTMAVNLRNRIISSRNKTGITGVYISKTKDTYGYTGKCSVGDKHYAKAFAINKYGKEKALELATAWRKEKLKELEQQGIFYTERHGT